MKLVSDKNVLTFNSSRNLLTDMMVNCKAWFPDCKVKVYYDKIDMV